jgi:L-fuculose-phosphate aldolase
MIFQKERELIVEYGKKMLESGLTKGTGGNISVFIREEKMIAITPSGVYYFKTRPEDVVIMDLHGNIIDGDKKPSSEYSMHKIFYEKREDIDSVVHLHSTYAATISCLGEDLPAVHYLVAVSGGRNVRCAKYATFGTKELAINAYEAMKDRYVVLLSNHGLLSGAKDLPNAYNKAEEIEFCSEIYCRAKSIGDPVILSDEEMDKILNLFDNYGQV